MKKDHSLYSLLAFCPLPLYLVIQGRKPCNSIINSTLITENPPALAMFYFSDYAKLVHTFLHKYIL